MIVRMRRARQPTGLRNLTLGLALTLAAGSFGFAPANDDALEYSKQLYAAGEEAMAAGDYAKALASYQEGYRYAPSLHIFTLNIATAADLGGDCATAKKYFQHFVDLVPEHEQHKRAEKRLAELKETCTAELPEAVPAPTAPSSDRKSRRDIEAERSLNAALEELASARDMYAAASNRFKTTRQLGRAGRRKKRHAKRMRKLIGELGVDVKEPEPVTQQPPKNAAEACRRGRGQESRIMDAMDTVLKYYDDNDVYRIVQRFTRWSERIDRPAFEECT